MNSNESTPITNLSNMSSNTLVQSTTSPVVLNTNTMDLLSTNLNISAAILFNTFEAPAPLNLANMADILIESVGLWCASSCLDGYFKLVPTVVYSAFKIHKKYNKYRKLTT